MNPHRRKLLGSSLTLAALSLLSACSKGPSFKTTDISGTDMGPALDLVDHTGRRRRMTDFRGKVVVVFFGYTMCPDVCPTSLMMLKEALSLLGPDADRVQVLFVSVDPARDTPQQLASYVTAFDSRFLGLTGSDEEIARVAKGFKVIYEKKGDVASGRYTMDHTAGYFIFDPQGRTRLFARHGETAARVAADIALLLASA